VKPRYKNQKKVSSKDKKIQKIAIKGEPKRPKNLPKKEIIKKPINGKNKVLNIKKIELVTKN